MLFKNSIHKIIVLALMLSNVSCLNKESSYKGFDASEEHTYAEGGALLYVPANSLERHNFIHMYHMDVNDEYGYLNPTIYQYEISEGFYHFIYSADLKQPATLTIINENIVYAPYNFTHTYYSPYKIDVTGDIENSIVDTSNWELITSVSYDSTIKNNGQTSKYFNLNVSFEIDDLSAIYCLAKQN